MGLLESFLIVLVIGLVVGLSVKFLPMPDIFKNILIWGGAVVAILVMLAAILAPL